MNRTTPNNLAAVVSIGTNSTRALVADLSAEPRVVLARSTGTRIGEGLKETGHLDPQAMARTLDALRDHVRAVREHTNDICAIATSALRRASNGQAFAEEVAQIAGARLEIVSGEEEARRSFLGAVSGLPDGGTFGVLDVGGGSSEYALGTRDRIERVVSCEIGAVRLTEAVPELDGTRGGISGDAIAKAHALAREQLAPVREFPKPDRLVFVGGTATTSCAVLRGSREMFAYAALARDDAANLAARLRKLPLERRKALPGMNPQRADIILGGLLLLDDVFAAAGRSEAAVSTNDLLLGTLLLRRQ